MEITSGPTVGGLLAMLAERHGDPFRQTVFKDGGGLRSTALMCVNDCNIAQLQCFKTPLGSGEKISVGVYPPEGG